VVLTPVLICVSGCAVRGERDEERSELGCHGVIENVSTLAQMVPNDPIHAYLTCAIPMYKRWLAVAAVRGTTKAASPDDTNAVASIGRTTEAKNTAKKFVLIVSRGLNCLWLPLCNGLSVALLRWRGER